MEIKINKEIRLYSESVVLGLCMREFIFSCIAVVLSVVLYFALKDKFSKELISWVIIASAAPCAFFGFYTYNGMSAEKAMAAFIKSELLESRYICFSGNTLYKELTEVKK